MKKILFFASILVLTACGEKKEEALKLESFEDKLAYTLGAFSARDLMDNQNFDAKRLDKAKLNEGFVSSYNNFAEPDCGPAIEGLLGKTGTDFNEDFLADGSRCIGQFLSFSLFAQLDGFDKASSIDTMLLYKGFSDGLTGNDTIVLTLEDQEAVNKEFSEGIQALIQEKMDKEWEGNRLEGENFLAENGQKEGVITTASGLQYEIIKKGNGKKPTPNDQVKVHYHGTSIDGNVFDSSVERDEPAVFGVTQVISGWTEVLQLMDEGSKYRVYVPQELAYGAYPQPGGPIKPYSMLIFDIELLEIK